MISGFFCLRTDHMNMCMSSFKTLTYLILEWVCHGILLLDNGPCERNGDMIKKPN